MTNPPVPNSRSAGRLSDPLTGRFRIVNATGQVNWSDELFRIYGFAAGEVRPTLSLMQTHQHHDDRAGWAEALRDASRLPGPVTRWHRIITAARKDRNLVTTFRPHVEQGRVVGIDGLSIDITDQIRQDRADEVTRAVVRAAETRAVIDQAKGILMATLDLDEDRSFELLRWYSSYANVKVRNIASILVERLAGTQGSEIAPHQRITELLAEMGGAAPAFPDIAAELTEVSARRHQIHPRAEGGARRHLARSVRGAAGRRLRADADLRQGYPPRRAPATSACCVLPPGSAPSSWRYCWPAARCATMPAACFSSAWRALACSSPSSGCRAAYGWPCRPWCSSVPATWSACLSARPSCSYGRPMRSAAGSMPSTASSSGLPTNSANSRRLAAAWIGAVPAVVLGGIGTMAVAAIWSQLFPGLRRQRSLDKPMVAGAAATAAE